MEKSATYLFFSRDIQLGETREMEMANGGNEPGPRVGRANNLLEESFKYMVDCLPLFLGGRICRKLGILRTQHAASTPNLFNKIRIVK